jgi:hypothetical protein
LEAFDAPDNIGSTDRRNRTTTPTQALLMFNSPALLKHARALASRLDREAPGDDASWIAAACRATLGRSPESWELSEFERFLDLQTERIRAARESDESSPRRDAREDLCHVLLNANEFLYVD